MSQVHAQAQEFINPDVSRAGLARCPPRYPQTNGMVERFNARISEVVNQTRFTSAADLEATLIQCVKTTTT